MTSDRPYRTAFSFRIAREEIVRCSGAQFDPDVVQAFLKIPEKVWKRIRAESLTNDFWAHGSLIMRNDPAIPQQPRVIVHSTADDKGEVQESAQEHGGSAILTKPPEPAVILQVVTSVLGPPAAQDPPQGRPEKQEIRLGSLDRLLQSKNVGALEQLQELISASDRVGSSDLIRTLSLLSHDLLNPLGNVMGFSDLLLDETRGPLTPAQQQLVQKIRESAAAEVLILKELRRLKEQTPNTRGSIGRGGGGA